MENKNNKQKNNELDGRYGPHPENAVPGINNPSVSLPAFNPPVPNRAWTSMREELGNDVVNPKNFE